MINLDFPGDISDCSSGSTGLKNAVLLVFANKQDLANAMMSMEVAEKLELLALPRDRQWKTACTAWGSEASPAVEAGTWYIQSACGLTGEGICEGFDWLSDATQGKKSIDGI